MNNDLTSIDFWLHHSLRLIRERVRHFNPAREGVDRLQELKDELNAVEACYQHRDNPDALRGKYAAWWAYERAHAALQVERYAGRLDDATFRARCKELRRVRGAK